HEIVFPCKIVEAFADEAAIGTEVLARVFPLWSCDYSKGFCFVRLKVSLKNERIRFVESVVVSIDSLRKHFLARTIAHVKLHQILFADWREGLCSQFDRFALTGDIQFINRGDCQLCLLGRVGWDDTCESKNQKSKLHSDVPQLFDRVTAEDST